MNRASSATGWVRNPIMKSPDLDPHLASSYELGWTLNQITGCLNHTPEGLCLGGLFPCYAYKLANGRLKPLYLGNKNHAPTLTPNDGIWQVDPFYPRFWEDRLGDIPLKPPRGIFVCDMSDLLGIGIPEDWTERVLNIIKGNPQHRFYLLTKQPQNLIKFSPFPDNCWVGVTVTKPEFLLPALDALDSIQCSIRYLSIEPMLGRFNIPNLDILLSGTLNWLITGTQTKPYRPPAIEDVEEIVRACDKAGIPVFLKDNLRPLFAESVTIDDKWVWAKDIGWGGLYRQELPNEKI